MNSVTDNIIDDSIKLNFLRLIDQLTPLHLKVLEAFYKDKGGSNVLSRIEDFTYVTKKHFPEIQIEMPLFRQCIIDLESQGLIERNYSLASPRDTITNMTMYITAFGLKFRNYINEK